MRLTPRQVAGLTEISGRLDRLDTARDISTGAMASRSAPRDIKKRMRELQKD